MPKTSASKAAAGATSIAVDLQDWKVRKSWFLYSCGPGVAVQFLVVVLYLLCRFFDIVTVYSYSVIDFRFLLFISLVRP